MLYLTKAKMPIASIPRLLHLAAQLIREMRNIIIIILSFPIIVNAQQLTNNTNINITKSWSQQPNGYNYPIDISVPTGNIPSNGYPICVILHGNGGNGSQMINQFSSILECHVIVAPTGYMNSWNVCAENSDGPDIQMVNDLVDSLQLYSNINPNKIRILGSSNGAGLANNIFIENTNSGIDIICAVVSHLNEPQYHSGNFHKIGSETDPSAEYCGYNAVSNPLQTRKYLSISNDNDPIIPYLGGYSMVGLDFLHAEDAAYAIAQNQGYNGNIITGPGIPYGNPVVFEYSYLSGNVVHIRGNAEHSMNSSQEEYLQSFFNDCSTTTNINDIDTETVKVYPNPVGDVLTIEINNSEEELFEIYSLTGLLILRGQISSKNRSVELSSINEGVYVLKIGNKFVKIVKSK
jgi:poly(3-hydroxybutyrate) depolymerase